MLYGTTSDFLRCFGLSDLDSLPKTSDELIEVFEGAKIQENNAEGTDEEAMTDGEQLTLDIENAMDGMHEENATENTDAESSETENTVEETVEFEDPSADEDIYED
jgi:hypothetical protein